jgi:hypothetical protein
MMNPSFTSIAPKTHKTASGLKRQLQHSGYDIMQNGK